MLNSFLHKHDIWRSHLYADQFSHLSSCQSSCCLGTVRIVCGFVQGIEISLTNFFVFEAVLK